MIRSNTRHIALALALLIGAPTTTWALGDSAKITAELQNNTRIETDLCDQLYAIAMRSKVPVPPQWQSYSVHQKNGWLSRLTKAQKLSMFDSIGNALLDNTTAYPFSVPGNSTALSQFDTFILLTQQLFNDSQYEHVRNEFEKCLGKQNPVTIGDILGTDEIVALMPKSFRDRIPVCASEAFWHPERAAKALKIFARRVTTGKDPKQPIAPVIVEKPSAHTPPISTGAHGATSVASVLAAATPHIPALVAPSSSAPISSAQSAQITQPTKDIPAIVAPPLVVAQPQVDTADSASSPTAHATVSEKTPAPVVPAATPALAPAVVSVPAAPITPSPSATPSQAEIPAVLVAHTQAAPQDQTVQQDPVKQDQTIDAAPGAIEPAPHVSSPDITTSSIPTSDVMTPGVMGEPVKITNPTNPQDVVVTPEGIAAPHVIAAPMITAAPPVIAAPVVMGVVPAITTPVIEAPTTQSANEGDPLTNNQPETDFTEPVSDIAQPASPDNGTPRLSRFQRLHAHTAAEQSSLFRNSIIVATLCAGLVCVAPAIVCGLKKIFNKKKNDKENGVAAPQGLLTSSSGSVK